MEESARAPGAGRGAGPPRYPGSSLSRERGARLDFGSVQGQPPQLASSPTLQLIPAVAVRGPSGLATGQNESSPAREVPQVGDGALAGSGGDLEPSGVAVQPELERGGVHRVVVTGPGQIAPAEAQQATNQRHVLEGMRDAQEVHASPRNAGHIRGLERGQGGQGVHDRPPGVERPPHHVLRKVPDAPRRRVEAGPKPGAQRLHPRVEEGGLGALHRRPTIPGRQRGGQLLEPGATERVSRLLAVPRDEGASDVELDGPRRLGVVVVARLDELGDALCAVGIGPPVRRDQQRHGVTALAVVGRGDEARRRVEQPGVALVGQRPDPVVFAGPSGHREEGWAPRAAQGDGAGELVAEVAGGVGEDHVLIGTGEVGQRGDQFVDGIGQVHRQNAVEGRRRVVRPPPVGHQFAPRHRVHGRHHRTVTGFAHRQAHRPVAATHRDHFLAHPEGLAPVGRQVARGVGRVHALDEEVGVVDHGVGEAPGHPGRVAGDHSGGAREALSHHVEAGRVQPDQVPDVGVVETQVHVVGDDGRAARGAGAAHDPGVGGAHDAGRLQRRARGRGNARRSHEIGGNGGRKRPVQDEGTRVPAIRPRRPGIAGGGGRREDGGSRDARRANASRGRGGWRRAGAPGAGWPPRGTVVHGRRAFRQNRHPPSPDSAAAAPTPPRPRVARAPRPATSKRHTRRGPKP